MKIKFNWWIGIFLIMLFFIIFVIYIAFFFPNINSQLISNKYYEEEIKYQEVIDEKINFNRLPNHKKLKLIINEYGILIFFPEKEIIEGLVYLVRFSSKELDIKNKFNFCRKNSDKKLFFSKKKLKKGFYKIIIRWKSNNKKYFFEKNLYLK